MPYKSGVFLSIAFLLAGTINAQRPKSKPNQPAVPKQKDITVPATFGNLPIIVDTSSVVDTIAPSIKPPNAFGLKPPANRIVLPYEHLRWDDALYVQKVWRELDLREKMNQTFRYDAEGENGSQLFTNILLRTIKSGKVQAFSDDRFSSPVTAAELNNLTQGPLDTSIRYDFHGKPDALIVTRARFDPKTVGKIRLMEEWIFDRESSRMHCRIIGVALLKTNYLPNGKEAKASSVIFWVNYPELRQELANFEIYNPKNMGQSRMTWEELFESRMFSSYIVKSTLDNASNRPIRAYIKDPVLAILEGENIKDKIFNYEQDLWSY